MAKEIVLSVLTREARGRGEVRKLRADGLLPGVIYGPGIEPVALSVPRSELLRVLHQHGAHPLVTVKVEGGKEYLALVKDLQIDAARQLALHVDFHRVQEDKPVQTDVDVALIGTPAGVKLGGILETIIRTVTIEALPRDLPEQIEFDVSALEMGSVARIGDLVAPPGVRIVTDHDQTMCSVAAPRVEEAAPLSAEDAEALAALSEEDLAALKEFAAAAPAAGAPETEASGEGGGDAEGDSE